MINEKINNLRNQLNFLIYNEEDYDKIYAVSIELDKLILEYYKSIL